MGFSPTGGGGVITPPATPTTTTMPQGGTAFVDASGRTVRYDASGNLVDANTGEVVKTSAQVQAEHDAQVAQAQQQIAAQNGEGYGSGTITNDPTALKTLVNIADKDNPVAGTIHAGEDLANGDYSKALGDFTQGATFGTIPVGGNVLPSAVSGVTKLPGAIADAGSKLVNGIGDVLSGAPDPSTDALGNLSNSAVSSQQELDAIRRNAEANPTQAPQSQLVQLDQTNINPLRRRQGVALDALTAAANGTTPSAADIAGKAAADRAAAQAYGTAAALQGGNSSGGALRQALDAGTQLQADANQQMLVNRANEQATARGQLVQGLQAATNEEGNLSNADASLSQSRNLANQQSDVTTHGQDISREENLISGANANANTANAAAKAALDAKVQEQANNNAMKGAEINAAGGIVGNIIKSDRRAKKNVKSVGKKALVQLADDLPAKTFDYKDPQDGPGRRVGVLAQDALRSRVGKGMVQLDGDGALVLDVGNSLGAALAMAAEALREAEKAKVKPKARRK